MTRKRGKKVALFIVIGIVVVLTVLFLSFMSMMKKQSANEDPTYWEKDIKKIEARYEGKKPNVDMVFIGSSSIRKWVSLESDMAPYKVVNHGFGGSKVQDSTYYYDRLVTPFKPEVIVFFAGTNDINGIEGISKSGEEVFEKVKEFYEKSQSILPDVPVYYISISPTKARWKAWEDAKTANELIEEYANTQKMLTMIDTTDELLNGEGLPNEELFVFDKLHLNEEGYKLWNSIIRPIVTESME